MRFAQWLENQSPPITCRIGARNPLVAGVQQVGHTVVHFNVRGSDYAFLVDTGRVDNGWLRRALKYTPGAAFNELNKDITVRRSPPRS